jgi:hypothetical protein
MWLCILILACESSETTSKGIAQTSIDTVGLVQVPIDTKRSVIFWKGTEMRQSGKHEGTVNLKEGYLLMKQGHIVGGHVVADMHSIAVTDIPKNEPVPRKRLTEHLKSDDFFYVEKYPTAEFEITETISSDSLSVFGNLLIKDVSRSIDFTARTVQGLKSITAFEASFTIDRFEWNISYQGSYWDRISSIIDNNFVDADIILTVMLIPAVTE